MMCSRWHDSSGTARRANAEGNTSHRDVPVHEVGEFLGPCLDRFLHHTYILDIIRSYCLVVAIYGTLGYNNNVQPFLISTVLKGIQKQKHLKT